LLTDFIEHLTICSTTLLNFLTLYGQEILTDSLTSQRKEGISSDIFFLICRSFLKGGFKK